MRLVILISINQSISSSSSLLLAAETIAHVSSSQPLPVNDWTLNDKKTTASIDMHVLTGVQSVFGIFSVL